jgi:alcohol dehydrogenase class IV
MTFFYCTTLVYGSDALNFLEKVKGEKCYIITDKNIKEVGLLKILTDRLDKLGKKYEIFDDIVPDPHEESVYKAKEKLLSYEPDIIIGFGGGSVIDVAKAAWALYELPELNRVDDLPFNDDLYEINTGKKSKMIFIPTTSGTGAESSIGSVISRFENDVWRKMEIPHMGLIPTFIIIDPIFPAEMPPTLTANTGFDALAHSLEGVTASWRNDISDAILLKSVELIFKWLPIAYKDGKNMEARDKMHLAASMAGVGFGNSMAHIGHTLGHAWGAVFHNPHGSLVGLFLPYLLQFCLNDPSEANKTAEILGKMAKQLGWAKWEEDNKKATYVLIDKVKQLQKEVNLRPKLQDLGISRDDMEKNLDTLVSLCYQSPICTAGPRSPSMEDWKNLFRYPYDGKDLDF